MCVRAAFCGLREDSDAPQREESCKKYKNHYRLTREWRSCLRPPMFQSDVRSLTQLANFDPVHESVRFSSARGRNNSVHAQVLDHLSVVIECVLHTKYSETEASRFASSGILQHVLDGQSGGSLVTERE
jgi:hypothetical protein